MGELQKDTLDFSASLLMAIVNCNADSFYADSRAPNPAAAVEKALQAESDGADIIDFGGESTRPGSIYVSAAEELARVLPAVQGFRRQSALPVSVDTRKAVVARAVLDAGANIVNDVSAFEDDSDMAAVCAEYGAYVVLMHKKGSPETMQAAPFYTDVVREVSDYLRERAEYAESAGIARGRIILDPGIGFGKGTADNIALIRDLAEIRALGYPVLLGLSRKAVVGDLTGRGVRDRLAGTLAANAAGLIRGANIIRVHDVREHADLLKVWKRLCDKANF